MNIVSVNQSVGFQEQHQQRSQLQDNPGEVLLDLRKAAQQQQLQTRQQLVGETKTEGGNNGHIIGSGTDHGKINQENTMNVTTKGSQSVCLTWIKLRKKGANITFLLRDQCLTFFFFFGTLTQKDNFFLPFSIS